MRVVCHAQHLTGVGHYVRMHCLAAGLAQAHEVYLVDGGRPVPRPPAATEPARIVLPRLVRSTNGELIGEHGEAAGAVLTARVDALTTAVAAIRPEVVLVDHYPFSKWELTAEIDAMVDAARTGHADARVVCSLRDIAPQTRHEHADADAYAREVVRRLDTGFDAVLVHGDTRWSRLRDHFPATDALTVPVRATGFVVEPVVDALGVPTEPFAVASAGGLGATGFLLAVIAAHARCATSNAPVPGRLEVFAPAGATDDVLAVLRDAAGPGVTVHGFDASFGAWLDAATLSVSRAGYNTCAALLRGQAAAVLVPDPRLSDQPPRARALARAGAAVALESDAAAPDVVELARAMAAAGAHGRLPAAVAVDGVEVTRALLERLVAGEAPWAPECPA